MTPTRWQEIERIYAAALERPPEERAALLRRACGDDSGLWRMVESLLEARTGDGLHDLPVLRFADLLSDSAEELRPGKQLGPYLIEGELGAGGMGAVYRAIDTRLGRPVAIKISSGVFDERFEREARAIASLNHPHICTLYDVGPKYMVMELVEGETLRDWLKSAPSVDSGLAIAEQVLDALRAAHNSGIVHRDLKPANIMVRSNGYVKVLDFGLAKRIPGSGDFGTEPTATLGPTLPGQVPGTPAYMSPEQIVGQKVDRRSDLFAFGIILYEILTGAHPWVRKSQVDTLHAIVHDAPPSMSAGSAIGPGLIAVVEKLLRKNPDERYSSAEEVLAALAAEVAGQGASQDRANSSVRRSQGRAWGATAFEEPLYVAHRCDRRRAGGGAGRGRFRNWRVRSCLANSVGGERGDTGDRAPDQRKSPAGSAEAVRSSSTVRSGVARVVRSRRGCGRPTGFISNQPVRRPGLYFRLHGCGR